MAITTAAKVRTMIKGSIASDDSTLTTLIARVSAVVSIHLGYPPASVGVAPTLESASYTRRSGDPGVFIDPEDRTRLYLEPYPVTAIASVHESADLTFPASSEVVSADREQRGSKGQIIHLLPLSSHVEFSIERGEVKVSFTAGYTSIPAGIEEAVIEYVVFLFHQRTRSGLSSVSEGAMTTAYRDPGMPVHVRELLSPYRMGSSFLHA